MTSTRNLELALLRLAQLGEDDVDDLGRAQDDLCSAMAPFGGAGESPELTKAVADTAVARAIENRDVYALIDLAKERPEALRAASVHLRDAREMEEVSR